MRRMAVRGAIAVLLTTLALGSPATAMPAGPRAFDPALPVPAPKLLGYRLPVDSPLVLSPWLLPGASRDYRAGIHEGIDLSAPYGMTVRAARDGVVVRIDRDYVEWSFAERAAALATAVRAGATPVDVLDRVRGRLVWLDHGDGVITRYAHLSAVAELGLGDRVEAGAVVGAVGMSGLPEGGPHLHFEVRVGDGYLGQGLGPEDVRYLVARLFSPDVTTRECER
jgi:murein DD-endopeptidase MepM/ murein hydrolase activator NlpD